MHSQYAIDLVKDTIIGLLQGSQGTDKEMGFVASPDILGRSAAHAPRRAAAPRDFPARIVSCAQLNTASDFPVFHYKLLLGSVKEWDAFAAAAAGAGAATAAAADTQSDCVEAGARVYLSLQTTGDAALRRP